MWDRGCGIAGIVGRDGAYSSSGIIASGKGLGLWDSRSVMQFQVGTGKSFCSIQLDFSTANAARGTVQD
ncbi:hypothetical protein XENTR_v10007132 [Xenopus tropicalis]|nr:hypothetical protein XENTR_v10013747 [Xenopus tropicalis]KAE8611040.1 hypothetical protein XENTR_v10012313 [Xenopus tropicalis]KAE8627735.1 hypothetical protein XENTR_v10007132 [Xenopus tropicalis]